MSGMPHFLAVTSFSTVSRARQRRASGRLTARPQRETRVHRRLVRTDAGVTAERCGDSRGTRLPWGGSLPRHSGLGAPVTRRSRRSAPPLPQAGGTAPTHPGDPALRELSGAVPPRRASFYRARVWQLSGGRGHSRGYLMHGRARPCGVPRPARTRGRPGSPGGMGGARKRGLSWGPAGSREGRNDLLSSRSQVRVLPGAPAETPVFKIE